MVVPKLKRSIWFVVGFIISSLILLVEMTYIKPWPMVGDAVFYYAMAKDPFVFITSQGYVGDTWGFRILVPWLVHILPVPIDVGFRLVTMISLLLAALVLYVFLTELGFSPKMAILGQILFLTDISIVYSVANFWYVDPLTYVFFILGLHFAWVRRKVLFSGSFALAVLAKQIQFLLVPVYYLINKSKGIDLRCLRDTLLVSCPAILTYLLLHLLISGTIEEPVLTYVLVALGLRPPTPTTPVSSFVTLWMNNPFKYMGLIVFSWSLLWITMIIGYLKYCQSTRVRALISLVVIASLLAIPFDTSRALAYAFPAVIVFSLCTLSSWSKSRQRLFVSFVILQIILQVFLIAFVLPK